MFFKKIITSSENKGSSEDFDKVTLDDNLLIFESITIQIQNISRLSSYVIERRDTYKFIAMMLNIINIYYQNFIFMKFKYDNISYIDTPLFRIRTGDCFFLFIFSCVLLLFFWDAFFYKRFGVQIQTDGGTVDQLITKNKEAAKKLYTNLIYLINNFDKNKFSGPVTLYRNCHISRDHIYGDVLSNIENSYIKNRSENTKE